MFELPITPVAVLPVSPDAAFSHPGTEQPNPPPPK